MTKHYLLICEIGPIYDFVRHSRKTKDYWAASFLFSYFMAEVTKFVEAKGAKVFLPYLKDNPMVTGSGKIDAGSVPDQLYFLVNDGNKKNVKDLLKTVIEDIIDDLRPKIEKAVNRESKSIPLEVNEIKEFFNFFFIIHPIKKENPTPEEFYDEFIEAERKIKMRAVLKPFIQTSSPQIKKWEKCSLCGDRKKVVSIKVDTKADYYNDEHICSVCIFKRYLWEALDNTNITPPKYHSTSDVALSPIKEVIDNKIENSLKTEYEEKIKECKNESEQANIPEDTEGRYFYDTSREKFTKWKKQITERYPNETKLNWLNRPFYAIVYMDGDNMGKVLKENKDDFNRYIGKVSEKLSEFSNGVNKIITGYNGQLIFAGGEDINFVIHPEYMLDCIKKLNEFYNKLFAEESLTKPMKEMFTLSAGAVVCYHKYPLSEAINRAGMMLKDHAKQHKGKNATAISLIKGHTEALDLTFSNNLIDNLRELKECLIKSDISRTTPYRIEGHKELLGMIADEQLRKNFLYTIIAGTRNPKKENEKIKEMVELLTSFSDMKTMISALLFARFLTGDRNA